LKDYYEERGLLTTVDARKPIPEVTEEILAAVGEDGA
jgi:adenylate kinase family enzyme